MKPRSTLLYGESGTSKTTQLYFLVKHYLEKWRKQGKEKRFRLIRADGGGYAPFQDSGMIERGEVEVFDITSREHAFADIHRLGCGYWPRKARDKQGREVLYFKSDEKCITRDWGKIGGYLIEGATSISSCLLNHLRNQDPSVYFSKDSKMGQLKGSFVFKDDDYETMGGQESHYGMVQSEMYQIIVQEFGSLPVEVIVWTALVGSTEDKRRGVTLQGPQLAGNKRTSEMPAWFMDTYHLSDEILQGEDGKKRMAKVAWFVQHSDAAGVPFLCKPRVLPEKFPKLLESFPNGFCELGYEKGINKLIEVVEGL